jgi:hypothetical protein
VLSLFLLAKCAVYCLVYVTEINTSGRSQLQTEMQVEARSEQNKAHCRGFLFYTPATVISFFLQRHCDFSKTLPTVVCGLTTARSCL